VNKECAVLETSHQRIFVFHFLLPLSDRLNMSRAIISDVRDRQFLMLELSRLFMHEL